MTDQEDDNNLGKIVFDDNNQEKKSWACLRHMFQIAACASVPTFRHFVEHLWLLLENAPSKIL